ncbi:class I SAM-dependent methyltransferase [Paenibacillus chartarius]|uniref:Class I SAM-dependent methyltransferase n=1 Tax=Paenibacillus chartarius TaxID=747481 RepID=A0ABV6DQS0_9BACL
MSTYPSPLLFMQKFLSNPLQVGSIIPSSRFLGQKMAGAVPWRETRTVVELGAGTGAITKHLLAQMHEDCRVWLFEKDNLMRKRLEEQFSGFTCHSHAESLTLVIRQSGFEHVDCIVSGLPFFNFPPALRETILSQVYQALKPGGRFIAFQYSLQMKPKLAERFELEQLAFVPLNFPPAFVYICRKKGGTSK